MSIAINFFVKIFFVVYGGVLLFYELYETRQQLQQLICRCIFYIYLNIGCLLQDKIQKDLKLFNLEFLGIQNQVDKYDQLIKSCTQQNSLRRLLQIFLLRYFLCCMEEFYYFMNCMKLGNNCNNQFAGVFFIFV
eukprot:TRINITY_DN3269_c0_g1_i14.p4 TRINITY_DN3269_c0_g1~~TRINITY_DN3269_c0_g1_i14.p4  ORF type:complete len:134 (+),score=2.22 TRINITY_DN3269_c0_g1_i14:132-533(+)